MVGESLEAVTQFLLSHLAEARGETVVATRSALVGGDAIDSLEGVELLIAAEVEYGIRIPDSELSSQLCSSLSALAANIIAK